ncbi:hypothetical protein D3C80_1286180 [compost metagenome]
MDHLDQIFKAIAADQPAAPTIIACLYTGPQFPAACAPMPRSPAAPLGARVQFLSDALAQAIALNPAVHDGAIMLMRDGLGREARVTGWSYRLFPAGRPIATVPNRGSAFHSCLSMSLEADVDSVFLVSCGAAFCFQRGEMRDL